MSVDKVKTYLQQWDRAKDVLEFPVSSATVQLAAEALHVKGRKGHFDRCSRRCKDRQRKI